MIVWERAADVETEDPPPEIVFEDTEVGLFQAPPVEDLDHQEHPTAELPAATPDDRREGSDDAT